MAKNAQKHGIGMGASRFIAGQSIEKAVDVVKKLNEKGMSATINHLGEHVQNRDGAEQNTLEYIRLVETIQKNKLDSGISLKLTSLGLDVADEITIENMRRILISAKENNVFVTIDMEDHKRCQRIIAIFKELRAEYSNVGTVLQAYLHRTQNDLDGLSEYNPRLRFVKGAYRESYEVAFPDKKDILQSFKDIIKTNMLKGNYTAVATHDDSIIDYTKELEREYGIARDRFEFQMLYGIRPERQKELAEEGYAMRVYVPYGKDWYGYFMRRLAERPSYVGLVLKSIFLGG